MCSSDLPDYLLLPAELLDVFVAKAAAAVQRMFPTLVDNPDYTSIVDARHYERLRSAVEDARTKGARVIELGPAGEAGGERRRRIPPTLILDPTDGMRVMQEEIFGPLLPVKTCADVDEAIRFVNDRPRPLALYYFGADPEEERRVLEQTTSGSAAVNDVVMQVAMEDLPFGGVGPSGMGAYHGIDGFRRFSHRKGVFSQPTSGIVEKVLLGMRPPYGATIRRMLAAHIRR